MTGFLSHVGSPKRDAELGHPTNSSIRDPVRSLGPWVFHRRKSSRGTTQVGVRRVGVSVLHERAGLEKRRWAKAPEQARRWLF